MDSLHATALGDILDEHRCSHPQKIAAVCGAKRFTYPELDDRVNRLATALAQAGVTAGDRVLWIGQNCHRLLETLLACARLGAVFCPINWRQSAEELAFTVDDFSPKIVLWQTEEIGDAIAKARAIAKANATWIEHDGTGSGGYEDLIAQTAPRTAWASIDPATSVLCMYTAAFSGRPAGALLSHTAVILQGLLTSKVRDIGPDYVYLSCGPLFHAATFVYAAATFLWAGTNVFTRRMDAEEICQLIHRERCNGAFLVSQIVERMVECNAGGKYDLKSLRTSPGTPVWNAMVSLDESPGGKRPGGYGQTELGGLVTIGALGGRPSPLMQVRIVGAEGAELSVGQVGEIVARGPLAMNGYHDRVSDTSARQRGGWHHTGDLGRREEDGSITFIGPRGRLIKSGLENIYPAEVELCLKRHAAVADCAVIGVPDEKWHQSVKAIVVLKPGKSATLDELVEHTRAHISAYKKPRFVEFVDAIPKKGGVLIDYDALDARFGGGGYPRG